MKKTRHPFRPNKLDWKFIITAKKQGLDIDIYPFKDKYRMYVKQW